MFQCCIPCQEENNLYCLLQNSGYRCPFCCLGPLLASLASGLTPSTRRNPVSTWSRPIFDPFFFRNLDKIVFGLSTPLICLGWPRNHHKKICLEILHILASVAFQMELLVQFCVQNNEIYSKASNTAGIYLIRFCCESYEVFRVRSFYDSTKIRF